MLLPESFDWAVNVVVVRSGDHAVTHSIVMRSKSGTVRYIEAHHNFDTKTWSPD